jgi:hypothetical protein
MLSRLLAAARSMPISGGRLFRIRRGIVRPARFDPLAQAYRKSRDTRAFYSLDLSVRNSASLREVTLEEPFGDE